MGRKAKWIPRCATIEDKNKGQNLPRPNDEAVSKTIKDYFVFKRLNPGLNGASLVEAYAGQQLNAGIDPGTIMTRLNYLTSYRADSGSELEVLERVRKKGLNTGLQRMKACAGGYRKKPWLSIETLALPLNPPASNSRDLEYQTFWWGLIVSGARPHELLESTLTLQANGLFIQFTHRKAEGVSGDKLWYAFEWSMSPPDHVKKRLKEKPIWPTLGTIKNVASNTYSWVGKWQRRQHPETKFIQLGTTFPRVRLDNVLRLKVESGEMKQQTYERLMNHSIETSDKHYKRAEMSK